MAEAGKMARAAISLRPFAKQDYGLILAAIRSSDERLEWAGPDFHWPLDEERSRDHGSRAAAGASRFLTLSADESATATLVGHAQFAVNGDHESGRSRAC